MKKILLLLLGLTIIAAGVLLIVGPTQIDKSLNQTLSTSRYPISDRAKALHQSLIIGDWHADTMLWNRDIAKQHSYAHVDLPRLAKGNVALQMFTTVTKSPEGLNYDQNAADSADNITKLALVQRWPLATWRSLTARALHQADKLHTFSEQNPSQLRLIKTQSDIDTLLLIRAENPALVGGLLGTEGSHALDEKLSNVQVLYDTGFRMMSLHHFFDNKLGASLHGQSAGGLTEFGKDVVAEINRLGIILDVSHSSEKVVAQTLVLSEKPLVVSHTGFKGHCDTARNISDDLMRRIAAKGGLIAVGYWDAAVCGESPSDIVAAIKYGIELVGDEHVSLGSDFDGSVTTGFDTSELAALTHEMLKSGFSETQIRKIMGENMLNFLQEHLPPS